MTVTADGLAKPDFSGPLLDVGPDVYQPQHDSYLLIEAMMAVAPPEGLSVADLCTGSGVVALAAAAAGAYSVSAFDRSPAAVECARAHALATGADIEVLEGTWTRAVATGPYDLVLCNPPYVPAPPELRPSQVPGPALAVNGGRDGRQVLDPLCAAAPALLRRHGTLLVVQSELADIPRTVNTLAANGLRSSVVAQKRIPFGPVLHSRARWLEETGLLPVGKRVETLAVIAAVKP
ncbi:methyltransferase domain-containing protein [Mycolicibacterium cosmeticum]|jgi:release factor glutamine methyltransferase|uniref:Methylase, putative n=1 Tax=Mycolicibacterium cosmeticum TaxID=258533 RepID=W9BL63_MYCCO|nr:HemK2/MTQ2 family protein methyltransferase [Mycolicibacterium cosmeticum]TLH68415.1 methyltransferase domain-containing protein [Mycolicibacterium cosmeticum]CDO09100.1 methylase, putative [Mycolicibacterium cosmeticum]